MISSIEERFWKKVNKSPNVKGCWVWTACKNKGYGWFGVGNKKMKSAHRFSWELENGEIPNNFCVLHKCDNPLCVNPNHLFLGTLKDNTADMISKGRTNWLGKQGSENHRAKLSEEQIPIIRKMLVENLLTQREIGNIFGVSVMIINRIKTNKIWKHVNEI